MSPCDLSPKLFSIIGNLIMHKRTHSRVKPFHCDQCPKTFSVAGDLNNQKETIVEINNLLVISDEYFEKSISFICIDDFFCETALSPYYL